MMEPRRAADAAHRQAGISGWSRHGGMVTGCTSLTGPRARRSPWTCRTHSEVIARVRSLPLCTAWLPDGHLVIVSSPDGRLLRREPDGSLVTHADLGRPGLERQS